MAPSKKTVNERDTHTYVVPDGNTAGDTIRVRSNGVWVTIPEGKTPGDKVTVTIVSNHNTLVYKIPEGKNPGDTYKRAALDGRLFSVTTPNNAKPGEKVSVNIGPNVPQSNIRFNEALKRQEEYRDKRAQWRALRANMNASSSINKTLPPMPQPPINYPIPNLIV